MLHIVERLKITHSSTISHARPSHAQIARLPLHAYTQHNEHRKPQRLHAPTTVLADTAELIGLTIAVDVWAAESKFAGENISMTHEQQEAECEQYRDQTDNAVVLDSDVAVGR